MAKSFEITNSKEGGNRFLRFWKGFNKVSAVVLATAGVVFENATLLGLAAIDIVQNALINRYQEWRARRKAAKQLGSRAVQMAHT